MSTLPSKKLAVRLLKDVYDDGQDHHPPGYVGRKGDVVYIHSVQTAVVSHDGTGHGFIVHDGELDLVTEHAHETLHVGASDWEEFGIAVRTVSQNCDMTDIARRGDWLQRELRARGFDIVRSGREDTPDEFRSAHVINVPWCQCCEARVPADHVCACEVIAEPSKEWWKCEYSGPGGQCGRDNHYARATCWYCHHPRVNAQKANSCVHIWSVKGPPRNPDAHQLCDNGCGLMWKDRAAVSEEPERP